MSAKQITVTIPGIVQYTGTIPNKATQTKDEFANAVHPYMNYMNTNFVPESVDFGTALSTFKIEANEVAEEVNANATAVSNNTALTLGYKNTTLEARDVAIQAKNEAEAIYDNFDDRYLGRKDIEPTVDNDGDPLESGALYYNKQNRKMYVYDDVITTWIDLSFVPTLLSSLSDVLFGTLADKDVLVYDEASGKWKNVANPLDDKADKSNTISKVASNVLLSGNVAISGSDLVVTDGKLVFTDGRDTNGGYKLSTQDLTGSVDLAGISDGIKYIGVDSLGNTVAYDKVSVGMYEKESADDNRLVFASESGQWYTTTGGELVTNGTFDTDVSGWTGDAVFYNGQLSLPNSGDFVVQDIPVVAGERYSINIGSISGAGRVYVYDNNDYTGFLYDIQETTQTQVEVVAENSFIRLRPYSNGALLVDNISVYKVEPTLDAPLTNPICFLDDKPYQITSETPMSRLEDMESIPKNIMESTTVDGKLEVKNDLTLGGKFNFTPVVYSGYLSANINTPSILQWTTEIDNTNSMSAGIFIVPEDGIYKLNCSGYIINTAEGSARFGLKVNNVSKGLTCYAILDNTDTLLSNSDIQYLSKDDTIQIYCDIASATNYISASAFYSRLTIQKIGA